MVTSFNAASHADRACKYTARVWFKVFTDRYQFRRTDVLADTLGRAFCLNGVRLRWYIVGVKDAHYQMHLNQYSGLPGDSAESSRPTSLRPAIHRSIITMLPNIRPARFGISAYTPACGRQISAELRLYFGIFAENRRILAKTYQIGLRCLLLDSGHRLIAILRFVDACI